MNEIIFNTVAQLGLNVAANAIWDVTKQYFGSTINPTKEGIIQLWANKFGSRISTEQAVFLANKIFEVRVTDGGQINLGEGHYQGGNSSIKVGTGAGIILNGNAGIIIS